MPKAIYNFTLRGGSFGGSQRCDEQAEAQNLYDKIIEGLSSKNEFIEVTLNGENMAFRASQISAFGINVSMEETEEERKQRMIAQINQSEGYTNYPDAQCAKAIGYGGNSLI